MVNSSALTSSGKSTSCSTTSTTSSIVGVVVSLLLSGIGNTDFVPSGDNSFPNLPMNPLIIKILIESLGLIGASTDAGTAEIGVSGNEIGVSGNGIFASGNGTGVEVGLG